MPNGDEHFQQGAWYGEVNTKLDTIQMMLMDIRQVQDGYAMALKEHEAKDEQHHTEVNKRINRQDIKFATWGGGLAVAIAVINTLAAAGIAWAFK